MPIEIKELHIRVAVNTSQSGPPTGGATAVTGGGGDKDALVAECVEQVLQILQDKSER